MDSRLIEVGVCIEICERNFEDYYELGRKCLARGELCEIREGLDKKSGQRRTFRVFRKQDLSEKDLELVF